MLMAHRSQRRNPSSEEPQGLPGAGSGRMREQPVLVDMSAGAALIFAAAMLRRQNFVLSVWGLDGVD